MRAADCNLFVKKGQSPFLTVWNSIAVFDMFYPLLIVIEFQQSHYAHKCNPFCCSLKLDKNTPLDLLQARGVSKCCHFLICCSSFCRAQLPLHILRILQRVLRSTASYGYYRLFAGYYLRYSEFPLQDLCRRAWQQR